MPVAAHSRSAVGSAVSAWRCVPGFTRDRSSISGDDLHGLGLHVAARVMASAIDGGVRLTAETVASLGTVEPSTRPIGLTTLRGIPGEWDLYELDDFAIH